MPDLPARRRHPAPTWTRPISERLTPAIKALVLVNTVVYLFYVFVAPLRVLLAEHVALGPGFARLEVWQPLTAMFVHTHPLEFVFNMIGLWFVGALIERTVGTRRFLEIFFVSGIAANLATGGLAWLLRSEQLFDGCGLAVLGLFVALARLYGRTPMQILGGLFLQARTLAMIMVAWALLAFLLGGVLPQIAGLAVAVAASWLLAGSGFGDLWDRLRLRRIRRRYRVIEGGASGRSRYVN
jgi:membrane associated rhomboid family serine protease